MARDFFIAPLDATSIDHVAALAADGDHRHAIEARDALARHRAKLMLELPPTHGRAKHLEALKDLRQLETLLERRIAQEVAARHDEAMRELSGAAARQAESLTLATWALVLATVGLIVVTVVGAF